MVVRVATVAVDPIDWILQSVGGLIFPWFRYPLVLGWDVAGEVTAVGGGVTRFGIGDRVIGLAVGQDKAVNDPAEGALQNHVLTRWRMMLAAGALERQGRTVSSAAFSVGYASEAAFSTAFKRSMGCSPQRYGADPARLGLRDAAWLDAPWNGDRGPGAPRRMR